MWRKFMLAGGLLALCIVPAMAGKLDNFHGSPEPVETPSPTDNESAGETYFDTLLPLTSAVMALSFPSQHAEVVAAVDALTSPGETDRQTALVDTLTRIAIDHELKLLEAPDAANTDIINWQTEYISALLEGEGADVCAPVIFNGSRELIGRGLYEKYSAEIDHTMASYFEAVKQAIDNPIYVGAMSDEDGAAVVAQMSAQGDKALMDHFGVMQADSPENCPAVLAIIEAAHVLTGDSGVRVRAAQARGASRL